MVKAEIRQLQAEAIFPIETPAHSLCRLSIAQVFHELEHGHQGQAPRGLCGLAMSGKAISELVIGVEAPQFVAQLHRHTAFGIDGASDTSGFFGHRWDRGWF